MDKMNVSKQYLQFREQVLQYTNIDMNLELENDEQVYIAVFDIPMESGIIYNYTKTLALVYGLNTHIYFGTGDVITDLEKNKKVMQAMQSLLISAHQVLGKMQLIQKFDFFQSDNIRVYLKTGKGIFFKELIGDCKEDKFLLMLLNNLRKEISEALATC